MEEKKNEMTDTDSERIKRQLTTVCTEEKKAVFDRQTMNHDAASSHHSSVEYDVFHR